MAKIVNVYFNGTCDSSDVPEEGKISLATLLAHITETDANNYSFCVNGCGESRDVRDLGVLFGFHLEKQVVQIVKEIEDIIAECEDDIVLNVYGFSRGGIAAFLLCQELKNIPKARLTINIASFEPVPVNFIASVNRDLFFGTKTTLAARVADLTRCDNIGNMLVLFTNQPLPDIWGFAPILPTLPTTCTLEVDVTPGRHDSAVSFYKDGQSVQEQNIESAIVFHRIVEFMQKCGTTFNFELVQLSDNLVSSDSEQLLDLYAELARNTEGNQARSMHLKNSIFTTANKEYLNIYHKKLGQKLLQVQGVSDEDCILSMQHH